MAPPRTLLIVDDDPITCEVLTLVAEEAGFLVRTCDSGEAALAAIALGFQPSAMLVDMQMPGLSGDALAQRLRSATPPGTVLVAMSGSKAARTALSHFDSFVLKPFSFEAFAAAVANAPDAPLPPSPTTSEMLSEATFESLASSMSAAQLKQLYDMCLDDSERRLAAMQKAAAAGDAETFCRGAHAIKGSCGMVGALELASLASAMEQDGPPPVDNLGPFTQFLAASARLRSMLDAHYEQSLQSTLTPPMTEIT